MIPERRPTIEEQQARLSEAAKSLGREGGLAGGPARARLLSKEELSEIGKQGAQARWGAKPTIQARCKLSKLKWFIRETGRDIEISDDDRAQLQKYLDEISAQGNRPLKVFPEDVIAMGSLLIAAAAGHANQEIEDFMWLCFLLMADWQYRQQEIVVNIEKLTFELWKPSGELCGEAK